MTMHFQPSITVHYVLLYITLVAHHASKDDEHVYKWIIMLTPFLRVTKFSKKSQIVSVFQNAHNSIRENCQDRLKYQN